RHLAEGFNYVRSNNTIMAVVLITIFMNLLLFPYMQMIPVIAKKVLDVGPGLMGLLMAADGLGALIGAVLIASSSTLTRHGMIYLGGSLLALFVAGMFAYSQWYFASLLLLLILGLGTAGCCCARSAARRRRSPKCWRARPGRSAPKAARASRGRC
ncbi:MAG: MFS transporter, partial [Proteobacteria bacterium]|nr:MFS transporter [Pseudomonadota bacterium]